MPAFTDQVSNDFRSIMIDAVHLGLSKERIIDFSMFLSIDFIACNCEITIFNENKSINIGKYFLLNQIK